MERIYVLYDRVSDVRIGVPMALPSDGAARRMFGDVQRDAESQLSRHPDDYELWCVGEFVGACEIRAFPPQFLERGAPRVVTSSDPAQLALS